jgi:hypothetical protein
VARDGVHASAAKRALGAVSPARANGVDARGLGVRAPKGPKGCEPARQRVAVAGGRDGSEWDSDTEAGLPAAATQPSGRFRPPPGLTQLSETTTAGLGGNLQTIQDYGHLYAGTAPVTHHLTLHRAPSGALVFGAGTVQWSWGLDSYHDRQPDPPEDRNMQQATVNLFADMGAAPTSLQSGLVPG